MVQQTSEQLYHTFSNFQTQTLRNSNGYVWEKSSI